MNPKQNTWEKWFFLAHVKSVYLPDSDCKVRTHLTLFVKKIPYKREDLITTVNRLILIIPPSPDNSLIIYAVRDPMYFV